MRNNWALFLPSSFVKGLQTYREPSSMWPNTSPTFPLTFYSSFKTQPRYCLFKEGFSVFQSPFLGKTGKKQSSCIPSVYFCLSTYSVGRNLLKCLSLPLDHELLEGKEWCFFLVAPEPRVWWILYQYLLNWTKIASWQHIPLLCK